MKYFGQVLKLYHFPNDIPARNYFYKKKVPSCCQFSCELVYLNAYF